MAKNKKCAHCSAKLSDQVVVRDNVSVCIACNDKLDKTDHHQRALSEIMRDPKLLLTNRHIKNEEPGCPLCWDSRSQLAQQRKERIGNRVWEAVKPSFAALPSVLPLCFCGAQEQNAVASLQEAMDRGARSQNLHLDVGTSWFNRCSLAFRIKWNYEGSEELTPSIETTVGYGSHGESSLDVVAARITLISKLVDFMQVVTISAREALENAEKAEERSRKAEDSELRALANQGPEDLCSGCFKRRREVEAAGHTLTRTNHSWMCSVCEGTKSKCLATTPLRSGEACMCSPCVLQRGGGPAN